MRPGTFRMTIFLNYISWVTKYRCDVAHIVVLQGQLQSDLFVSNLDVSSIVLFNKVPYIIVWTLSDN